METHRHHYLPEFHIKGFTNANNKVFVFDKTRGEIKKNEFSPRQIFFEWNRNIVNIEGEEDDFVENLYAYAENLLSPTYNKIKHQNGTIKYDAYDLFHLITLVSLTYWRLPSIDEYAKDFAINTPNNQLFIKIFSTETNEEASSEIYEMIKKREGFTQMYRLSKPIIDYLSLDIENNIHNWLIYGAASDIQLHLLGDNPIIFKNTPQSNILESELIFPLTKGITLFHTKGKKIRQIMPEIRLKMDILLFIQADKYVIGPNKEYLDSISHLSLMYDTQSKKESLRNEIFEVFE